jgi:hypothetical protein
VNGISLPATHPAFRGASRTCTYVHNAVRILSRGIHMTSALWTRWSSGMKSRGCMRSSDTDSVLYMWS